MRIIDVDSHFYEPFDWLEAGFPKLAESVPRREQHELIFETILQTVFVSDLPDGVRPPDALSLLPADARSSIRDATPEQRREIGRNLASGFVSARGGWNAADRIGYLDEQGIDCQILLPTFALHPIDWALRNKPDFAPDLIRAYNQWTQEILLGYTNRLMPTTLVDFEVMHRGDVLREMYIGRKKGSRSVAFRACPARGMALSHPEFDWFWAAAADLGLIAQLHIPAGPPAIDPAWFNNGRSFPSSILSWWEQAPQVVELLLTELILSGTFARHEKLRVLVSEYGVGWLPAWLRRIDLFAERHPVLWSMEPLRYPLRPSEYARKQLRVSPLPFDAPAELIRDLDGEIMVFCSDYPHPEGGANAVAAFREQLKDVGSRQQARFFGEIAAADLEIGR